MPEAPVNRFSMRAIVDLIYNRNSALALSIKYCLFKQGPALYSYNDALFTEEDWRGIQLLGQSVKQKDPMKVGKFGLGFKSVFHLTGKCKCLVVCD